MMIRFNLWINNCEMKVEKYYLDYPPCNYSAGEYAKSPERGHNRRSKDPAQKGWDGVSFA
jgi:hypothetical protein